jgi:hypothetical protein
MIKHPPLSHPTLKSRCNSVGKIARKKKLLFSYVEAVNDKGSARLKEDDFRGLKSAVHLAEGAKVMFIQNTSRHLWVSSMVRRVQSWISSFRRNCQAPSTAMSGSTVESVQENGNFFKDNPEQGLGTNLSGDQQTRNEEQIRPFVGWMRCVYAELARSRWKAQGQLAK